MSVGSFEYADAMACVHKFQSTLSYWNSLFFPTKSVCVSTKHTTFLSCDGPVAGRDKFQIFVIKTTSRYIPVLHWLTAAIMHNKTKVSDRIHCMINPMNEIYTFNNNYSTQT